MAYHIDTYSVSLDEFRERIEETDLVPSRAPLLGGIMTKFQMLKQYGLKTFADLWYELKNAKRLEAVSNVTGIDRQYLILLRRK